MRAHPSFLEGWGLDESSGTTAAGVNGRDGTYSGSGVAYGTAGLAGDANTAVTFTADDGGQVLIGNPAALQISTGTIVALIKTPSAGSDYRAVLDKAAAYNMYVKAGELMAYDNGGGADRMSGFSVNDDVRHMIAVRFQSGVASGSSFWADGSQRGSAFTMSIVDQNGDIAIADSAPNFANINGTLDEVYLYNTALSDADLLAGWNELTGGGGGGGDTTPPTVSGTPSLAADGVSLAITFTDASLPVLPASGITGFSVTVAGSSRSISSASRTANNVITLTLSSAATVGQAVTLSYAPGNVTDSASPANALASFSNISVINNSTVGGGASNAITMGQLILNHTYRSLGFIWLFSGDDDRDSSLEVWFKKASEGTYTRKALPPDRHPSSLATGLTYRAFHGSVLFLDPGEQYTFRFVVTDPDGVTAGANISTVLNDQAFSDSTRTASTSTSATVETATVTMRSEAAIPTNASRRAAANYYIRTDGLDTNSGTANTSGGAWRTIERAVQLVNAGTIPEHSTVVLQAGRTFAAPVTALTKGLRLVGATDPVNASGTGLSNAVVANLGSHTIIEDGPVSTTNQVYGTAPSSASPDVNYTAAQIGPWVLDTTTGNNLWRYDTTLGGTVTGVAPNQLGFTATKDGIPQRVPWWDAKSGTPGTLTLQGFSDLVWNTTNANRQNYGFWHNNGTTLYARFPGDINPNNYYTVLGNGVGIPLNNGANDVELRALVIRGFHSCIKNGSNGHVWYRLLVDRCILRNFWAGVYYAGVAPSTRGADDTLQYCIAGDSHQWIERSGAWNVADNQNLYSINRTFLKGTMDGMTGNRLGADGSENQFIYFAGGSKRITMRYCTLEQIFNGVTGYQPGGYDLWAAAEFDGHHNLFKAVTDEAFEPETLAVNWRVWNNRQEGGYNFYSLTPMEFGPLYIVNNVLWDNGMQGINQNPGGVQQDHTCLFFKFGKSCSFDTAPRVYVLHNTHVSRRGRPSDPVANGALSQPQFMQKTNSGGDTEPRWYLRGNIAIVVRYLIDYLVAGPDDVLSENYDFWATYDTGRGIKVWVGASDTNHVAIANYRTATGEGANSNNNGSTDYALAGTTPVDYILSQLTAPDTGNLTLVGGSPLATRVPPENNVRDVVYPGTGAWQPYHRADATNAALGYAEPGSEAAPPADTTRPVFNAASVPAAGTTVVLDLLEAGSPPVLPAASPTGFTIKVGGVTKSVSSVTRTGNTAYTFTLAAPVIYAGETVTIEYAPGNVTDSATAPNAMLAFSAQAVTNNSTQTIAGDTTRPVFASAQVPASGTTMVVTLTETGSPPVLPATGVTGFVVKVNGSIRSQTSASRTSNTQITLNLSSVVYSGQSVTVEYAPGNVTDSAATPNAMLAFAAQTATNNSTQSAPATPTLTSVVPNSAVQGTLGLTVTCIGTGFTPQTVVTWDGSPRSTTYQSTTQLQATITTADLSVPGVHTMNVI